MRTLTLLVGLMLTAVPSLAASKRLYFAEPMMCFGKIYGSTKKVNKSYNKVAFKFQSVWTLKKNCKKAPSLASAVKFFKESERINFEGFNGSFEQWAERYGSPLYFADGKVSLNGKAGFLGGTVTGKLKVVRSSLDKDKSGKRARYDVLSGYVWYKGTVSGDFGYKLHCVAKVVKSPSYVINTTKNCKRKN